MLKKDPFSFVVKKKSQFQKHKEAEEEKKKRAEAEAARVYEEFVESFKGEEEGPKEPSNAFVRGGVVKPGLSTPQGGTPAGKKSSRYVPSFLPPPTARDATRPGDREQYSGGREAAGATSRAGEGEDAKPASKAAAEAKGKAGRGRKIDALMQKLIQQQEDRERRKQARMEGKLTAEDMVEPDEPGKGTGEGDPCSTNLYLGNLSPDVEEETLKREFGRFGPLGSVKIMWPRDEEQRRKGRNCGFVAFMKREDAEKAKVALNGTYLHDFEMRIGWGKAVPLPLAPIWPPQAGVAVPNAGDPSSRDRPRGRRHNEPPPWAAASAGDHHDEPRSVHQGVGPDTEVQVPADGKLRFVIDSMAVYVMEDGCEFEQVVMEREKDNADFAWLFKEDCPEHLYYRWRLYSLASEDSLKTWRLEPFVMVEGGSAWVPPAMMDTGGSLLTAAQKGGLPNAPTAGDVGKEVRGGAAELPDSEAARFEDMLRSLTAERALIGEAMLFALDNANAACDVADILAQSLTLAETPVPAKIARLFLVSDILHNTSIPVRNASQYRKLFEERLPDVFESFQECLRAAESRIAQEGIKKHILRVLRVWRQGFIFTDDFLDGLRATLLHMGAGDADSEEHAELRKGLEDLPSEDLDRKCRVNGLSTRGGRVAQISRLVQLQALSRKGSAEVSAAAAPPQPAAPASSAPAAPKEAPAAAAAGEAAEVAASKMPLSRWATVDEDEERAQQMVQGPISKWIAEQDRQQRAEALTQQADGWRQQTAAQLAAVAAAAVPPASGAAGPLAPDAGGGGGDAGGIFSDDDGKASASSSDEGTDLLGKRRRGGAFGDRGNATSATQPGNVREGAGGAEAVNPAEDHRRQQLRDIEVKELEESGLRKEEVDKQVQQLRQQLTAQLPGAAAEPHGSGADSKMDGSGDTYSGEGLAAASASKPKSSAAERERGRDREVEKETEKDSRARRSSRDRSWDRSRRSRSRERDRDRDSKRDSYRERDNDRRSRRNRSRSSSRDRGRDDRRRSTSRSRDRDRDDRRRSRSRSRSRDWGKRDRRRDSKSHRSR